MGHIHKHQDMNKSGYPGVVYSGSLERIDFGEEDERKGFVWIEATRSGTRWEFVPMAVRRFVTINADATNDGETPTEAVLRAIERHDVTDAIVRVRVKLLQAQETALKPREIEAALTNAHLIAGIAKDIQRDARSRMGVENPETLTPTEALDRFFISKGVPRDRIDDLMKAAKELMGD